MCQSTRERVAAESGAVIARYDALGYIFIYDSGADGEAVA